MDPGQQSFLIVDDEPIVRTVLHRMVGTLFPGTVLEAGTGAEGLAAIENEHPDVVLLDLNLPDMMGENVLLEAKKMRPDVAVVIVSGENDLTRAVSLMKLGALDYVSKPVRRETLEMALQRALDRVRERRALKSLQELMKVLVGLLEVKDPYLQMHGERVAATATRIADRMEMPLHETELVEYAALMHDVGKIYVPTEILCNPGKLSDDEWGVMRKHPRWSHDALHNITLMQPALTYVLHHHERMDGKGYPDGLEGEEIPLGARVIAVADSFDAMTSNRSYREAMPIERARRILEENAGTQWDSEVVEVFFGLLADGWRPDESHSSRSTAS